MIATFAAGCFWHVEETFRQVNGVVKTTVGYTGGTSDKPSYKDVCSHTTGHAEAIELEFDPEKVTYDKLLDLFWKEHDPTSLNKQGADVGNQYRSAIFYHNENQKQRAVKSRDRLQSKLKKKIVTQIRKAAKFYPAEEYHQKYFQKHKLQKLFMCRM